MPSNSKRPLYLGTCLDDLHKLGEFEIGKREDPEKHLKVAEKAFAKAEELWMEGDEEKSFVLYMRYLNSIEGAKKTLDYSKAPKKFSVFISKDKFMTSISRGEVLKENLKKRYAERREAEEKLNAVPDLKETPQLPSVPTHETKVEGPFISPGELLPLLTSRPPTAVVLDCRGAGDRDKGVVTELPCVPLPTDRPLLSHSLADIKSLLSPIQIQLRDVLLVLMDTRSQELTAPRDSPLLLLRASLSDFDTESQLGGTPRILDGGYEAWSLHYPAYAAAASQSTPFTPSTGNDVTFPSIDSPPPQPKEDFFKPRRAPPPTPASRPTRDLDSRSVPDSALDPEDSDVINDSIETDVPPNYNTGSDVINTGNRDATDETDILLNPVVPSAPFFSPNGHKEPTYNPNIYIPTAILAPRLPYPINSFPQERPDFLTNSLPPKPADFSILAADPSASLPPIQAVSEEMGRELEEKEEKIRTLEKRVSAEQRGVELQKRQMLQEIANEKFQADRELGEKQRRLAEMAEQEKLKLKREKETLEEDKAQLEQEKKQVELDKQDLERKKLEFERVKRAVLEQQKLAQQAQAANPSHQFTTGEAESPQMQLNHGLPPGWKKLFDSNTGRFYYQDDKTKTTHWNPPTSWIVSQQPNIMQGKTKGALLSSFQEPKLPSQPTPTPSPATGPSPTPQIDRTTKPDPVRTPEIPSRASKHPSLSNPYYPQVLARIQAKAKSREFDPTHGGLGPVLTGLKNLGNTCFMNSILQCLSAACPLAEYFISLRFVQHVNPVNPLGMGGEMAEEFAFLVQTLWRGTYRSVAPRDFKRVLSRYAPQFSGSQQQDSQEFLAFLLDGLHEDLNKVMRKEYIQEQDNLGVPDERAAVISWENHLKRNDSIIVDLFQGQFKSTLTCLQCGFSSVTFEAFMYLSVPIPSSPHVTLIDCVRQFIKAERVSGSNSWFCGRCKTHRDSAKQLQIWRLPPVLLIHLKRFSFAGKWKQKLDTSVSYPLSGLDLSAMTLGPLKSTPYQLFAVSNHMGTLDGGHYTAFVRHPISKKFYTFDDSIVRDMSASSVTSKNGYMLFYTSVDFTPKLKL